MAMVMAAMITPRLIVPAYKYQLDDIAVHTLNAPRDFSVEDQKATEIRREERLQSVRSVYDFNSRIDREVEQRINQSFASLRTLLGQQPREKDLSIKARTVFQEQLKIQVEADDFNLLLAREFRKEIEDCIKSPVSTKSRIYKGRV